MRRVLIVTALFAAACASTVPRNSVDLSRAEVVDLTYAFDEHTLYWPSSPSGFEMKRLAYGPAPGGYFYASPRDSGFAIRDSGRRAESRIPNPESCVRPHRGEDDRAAAHRLGSSYGADAARVLKDFIVHQIAMGANVPGLENVANLDKLPPRGAYVIALPMKIAGGSGGPLRIVALLP